MNTAKQVNIMIGLLFVGLFGTLLYFLWDNGIDIPGVVEVDSREAVARERQELVNAERGGHLYALNCRSCHGLTGTGALERVGLPGAPLNAENNRPPELTGGALEARAARLSDTIHCGRVGTVMPPWSVDQNGPLNDFQIEQIVLLITSQFSLEAWEFAVEEANHSDEFDVPKHLLAAVGEADDTLELNDVSAITVPESADSPPFLIRIGGDTLEEPYELMAVLAVDPDANTIEVERGVENSDALAHEEGATVYEGPIAPGTTITGSDPKTDAPCGQAHASSPDSGGEAVELADGDTIEAQDSVFVFGGQENPAFTAASGITVTLANTGQLPHNLRIDGPDGEYDTDDDNVTDPDILSGGEDGTLEITLDPGTYQYQCDIHPAQMLGEITVE